MLKDPNKYNHTALFDADTVIWVACNPNKVMKKGVPVKEDGKFVYTPKTLDQAKATCDSYIRDILHLTKADSYILFITGGTPTFRHIKDKTYKANRVGAEKPLWYSEIKDHLRNEWGATEVPGLEADDLVAMTFYRLSNTFIISGDKDLVYNIPGTHFKAYKGAAEWLTITPKEAEFNFARALLTGDTADGVPNLIKGMGPKTAEAELKMRMEFVNPLIAAFLVYIRFLGQYDGVERFAHQYKMLKILDDFSQIPEGITYTIPEPTCWECVETILSEDFYKLEYGTD